MLEWVDHHEFGSREEATHRKNYLHQVFVEVQISESATQVSVESDKLHMSISIYTLGGHRRRRQCCQSRVYFINKSVRVVKNRHVRLNGNLLKIRDSSTSSKLQ